MIKSKRIITGCWGALIFYLSGAAQTLQPVPINAKIYPDSSGLFVYVRDVHLEFKFVGYGAYSPSDYPSLVSIPLENGERIGFENIQQLKIRPIRVYWKKFVEPAQRSQYNDIGPDHYRYWSEMETDVTVKTWSGDEIVSRIHRPDKSDVFITGQTERGDFNLQIDQENGKTVLVEFEAAFIMQCTKDINHLFPNMPWKYCPTCGGRLKRIEKPRR